MSDKGEFEKRVSAVAFELETAPVGGPSLVIRMADLLEILGLAKKDFPEREEASVISSDALEHSYETYDTEAVDCWFARWFGSRTDE